MKSPLKLNVFKKLAPWLAFCMLVGGSDLAWSAAAGKVVVAKGTVQATAAGKSRTLQRRSAVNEKDTISTGAASRTQLRFVDSALLTLNENSALAIQEYSFTGAGAAQDKVLMRLVRGGFRTVTGAVGKKDHQAYKVETPLASIGIRGTIFTVDYDSVQEILTVTVQEGTVTVTTGKESVVIGTGEKFNAARVDVDGNIFLFRIEREDQTTSTSTRVFQTDHAHDEIGISPTEDTSDGGNDWEVHLQGGT